MAGFRKSFMGAASLLVASTSLGATAQAQTAPVPASTPAEGDAPSPSPSALDALMAALEDESSAQAPSQETVAALASALEENKPFLKNVLGGTSRDTVAIPLPHVPVSVGIASSRFELFTRHETNSGVKIDAGYLVGGVLEGPLDITSRADNLHGDYQNYNTNFIGLSASKELSNGRVVQAYGGVTRQGEAAAGVQYMQPLSKESSLIVEGHVAVGEEASRVSAFYAWSRDSDSGKGFNQSAQAGVSLRADGNVVATAVYSAERKFQLPKDWNAGYLRTQFEVSGAADRDGPRARVGASVYKDVAGFKVGELPIRLEVGASATYDTRDGVDVKPGFNLGIQF